MSPPPPDCVAAVAEEIRAALSGGGQIPPFTDRPESLGFAGASRVLAALRARRGGKVAGRKIGFTNRALWARYGIDRPIWGHVWTDSWRNLAELTDGLALAGFHAPRIEPEIVLGLGRQPTPGMDEATLARTVRWIAPAFEIVQSIYPDWRFRAEDALAANGLHGFLAVGPRIPAAVLAPGALSRLTVRLARNGTVVEEGRGSAVLGGPLAALAYLLDVLAADPANPPLAAGEMISTGTMTDPRPVAPGETWSATFGGLPVPDIALGFR